MLPYKRIADSSQPPSIPEDWLFFYTLLYLTLTVKRNIKRFPEDFRFQLTKDEYAVLRSQVVTLNENIGRGTHRKYLPYVFTEQGIAMLSAVLRSVTAILISI